MSRFFSILHRLNMMSSDEEDTNIKGSSPGNMDASGFQASLLRPQLDTIFSEVEQNLPTIDFETSDVSMSNLSTAQFWTRLPVWQKGSLF